MKGAVTAEAEAEDRKRSTRACDSCRRRKIKCIPPEEEGKLTCVNCKQSKLECTYNENPKKRGPPKGYIEGLENRVNTLERLLKSLAPGVDFALLKDGKDANHSTLKPQPDNPNPDSLNGPQDLIQSSKRNLDGKALSHFLHDVTQAVQSPTTPDAPTGADGAPSFSFDANKFFGRSSGFSMVPNLSTFKKLDPSSTAATSSSTDGYRTETSHATRLLSAAWRADSARFKPPPLDLQKDLIDLYFDNFNTLVPLLHRPSFQRAYDDPAIRDVPQFSSLVFSVMAIGSRFSKDPRVFQDHGYVKPKDPDSKLSDALLDEVPEVSAGYAFAWAALRLTSPILIGATLYDMQSSVLLSYYFTAASALTSGWSAIGFYLRRMVDSGAHRRRNQTYNSSLLTDDLRKRAFWALFVLDRALSAGLGRPISIHDEDIDLDFPLEVSDEQLDRLDALNLPWPRERPVPKSTESPTPMHAFNASIQLAQITGRLLKQLYSIAKPPSEQAEGKPPWEQKAVAELDSALNAWLNRLPPHLKWNPQDLDSPFITQRGFILSMYYANQLLVHRDFLSPDRKGILGFPSQMIVVNAARSLCHILWNLLQCGTVDHIFPFNILYCLTAAMPLLSNVYATNKVPEITDSAFSDVQKCLEVMKALTTRCFTAYHTCEGLCRLADLDELRRMRNLKRSAPEEDSQSQSGSSNAGHSPQNATTDSPSSQAPPLRPAPAIVEPPQSTAATNNKRPPKRVKTSAAPSSSSLSVPTSALAAAPQSPTPPASATSARSAPQLPYATQAPLSTIDLPFYTSDLASSHFGDFSASNMAYQPFAGYASQPHVHQSQMDLTYDFAALQASSFEGQYGVADHNQYYAERQPAAILQQQPLANFFDPQLFGTSINDFTANQAYYR